MNPILEGLEEVVQAFKGRAGLAAEDVDSGATLLLHEREQFNAASVIKVGVMAAVYRFKDNGAPILDACLRIQPHHVASGSGVLKLVAPGRKFTVRELVRLMIVVSDNTATNALLDRVGIAFVNSFFDEFGMHGTRLCSAVDYRHPRPLGFSTPLDMCRLLAAIARGQALQPALCHEMLEVMEGQQCPSAILRYWPALDSLSAGSKEGRAFGVRGEAALIRLEGRRLAVCVLTDTAEDERIHVDSAPEVALARCGRAIHEWWRSVKGVVPLAGGATEAQVPGLA